VGRKVRQDAGGHQALLGLAQRRLGCLERHAAVIHARAHALFHQCAAQAEHAEDGHRKQQHQHDDQNRATFAAAYSMGHRVHAVRFLRLTTCSSSRTSGWPSVPTLSAPASVRRRRTATTRDQSSPGAAGTYEGWPSTRYSSCRSSTPSVISSGGWSAPWAMRTRYSERPPRPLSATYQRLARSFATCEPGP